MASEAAAGEQMKRGRCVPCRLLSETGQTWLMTGLVILSLSLIAYRLMQPVFQSAFSCSSKRAIW
jgi:hypothetical protein